MRILTTGLDLAAIVGVVVGVGLDGVVASATVAAGLLAAATSRALVLREAAT